MAAFFQGTIFKIYKINRDLKKYVDKKNLVKITRKKLEKTHDY